MENTITTCCRMKYTKTTASRQTAVPNLLVGDAGNSVVKHQLEAEVCPRAPPEQISCRIADKFQWSSHGKRSKRKPRLYLTTEARHSIDDIPCTVRGFPGGAPECPTKPSMVTRKNTRKTRKKKRKADENEPEVTTLLRSCSRGLRRQRTTNSIAGTQERGKLDSKTFEYYLEHLWREFPEEERIPFTYLDSLWFSFYLKKNYKPKVLDWIKRKNILSKKYVFVPIVQWSHWSLLILCHFGETGPFKNRDRCMLLLDSMQAANPKRLEPEIRRFIMDVYNSEGRLEDERDVKRIPLLVPKVPQQRNDKECGNYVLYYIKLFIESAPGSFSVSDFPCFLTEDWFTPQGVECFYRRLDSIRNTVDASDGDLSIDVSHDSSCSDIEYIGTTGV